MKEEITKEDLDGFKHYLIGHLDEKINRIEKQIDQLSKLLQDLNKDIEISKIEAKFNISETHLRIIDLLLKEYPKKYRAEEISESTGISRAQVFNLLGDLCAASFVEKDRIGKIVVYDINKERVISILDDRIKASKDNKTIAEESLRLGRFHYAQGNYDEGIIFVEKASNIFNDLKNERKLAECHNVLAKFSEAVFRFDEAIYHYLLSLELYTKLEDREGQSLTIFSLGSVQYKKGNYDEALEFYGKNLEICKNNQKEIAKTLSQIALINQIKGKYGMALEFYNKSLDIKKNLKERDGVVHIQCQIARIYYDKKEYDKALEFYKKSLEIEKEIENFIGVARTLVQIAMIHQAKGDYDQAINLYNESLIIDKNLGNHIGISRTLVQIATIYQAKGGYDQAFSLYNESLRIDKNLGNHIGISRTLVQIAMIYQAKGDYDPCVFG
jgi:tetratricopeptide (TPR) repeat protein